MGGGGIVRQPAHSLRSVRTRRTFLFIKRRRRRGASVTFGAIGLIPSALSPVSSKRAAVRRPNTSIKTFEREEHQAKTRMPEMVLADPGSILSNLFDANFGIFVMWNCRIPPRAVLPAVVNDGL
jgi:hypothetical protein